MSPTPALVPHYPPPVPIYPLPQFEADLKEQQEADRKVYESLKTPKTLVLRFGYLKLIGEYPYDGDVKPGCGSKMVVRTHRGVEIGEMLTSTCPNSGCSKSVSRKDMLDYIENSGGKEYPFFSEGKVYRVASPADMNKQAALEQEKNEMRLVAKLIVEELGIPAKIVEAEPLLGGERITFYYLSEERLELRELASRLGRKYHTRIELHHVGARDEARITADYERCGQYCCCKNFLKVLKPVSMKSAKVQKATLDPLKISGRCGRLMCCLRYEDQTYEELSKRLPRKKIRVGTPEGDGTVVDTQILTQLVLVRLDNPKPDGAYNDVAIPVENITEPESKTPPPPREFGAPSGGRSDARGPGGQSRGPGQPPRDDRSRGPNQGPRSGPNPGPGTQEAPAREQRPDDGGGMSRGQDRGPERGPDRGPPRGPNRGPNRGPSRGPGGPGGPSGQGGPGGQRGPRPGPGGQGGPGGPGSRGPGPGNSGMGPPNRGPLPPMPGKPSPQGPTDRAPDAPVAEKPQRESGDQSSTGPSGPAN